MISYIDILYIDIFYIHFYFIYLIGWMLLCDHRFQAASYIYINI